MLGLDLDGYRHHLGKGQSLAGRGDVAAEVLAQVLPGETLHREVVRLFVLREVVHAHDVVVVQPEHHLRFLLEARDQVGLLREVVRQHLQGDHHVVEVEATHAVHHALAAVADLVDDLVFPREDHGAASPEPVDAPSGRTQRTMIVLLSVPPASLARATIATHARSGSSQPSCSRRCISAAGTIR